uniref:HMA domain-containing protein n=2 Tax=Glycine subgen. Soja TaxID=1462606 RepID=A0A0R0HQB9_SOYBN
MLQKKNSGRNDNNKENKDTTITVVLKVEMHYDGCASKIIKHLRWFQGVETVKADSDAGKVIVTGKVDPTKVRDNLVEKIRKKVELVSPQPKKEHGNEKENKDAKPNNKSENNKTQDQKNQGQRVYYYYLICLLVWLIGHELEHDDARVHEMAIDKEKEMVTVKGTMDVKALAENLMEKLKRRVEVVPSKKDKEGGGGENEVSGKKKNKGGGGGDKNENIEDGIMKIEYNIMKYLAPPAFGFGYGPYGGGYGHRHGNIVACGGEDGVVECFDMRVRSSIGRIDVVGPSGDVNQEVTTLEFDEDRGFLMVVGSSAGKVEENQVKHVESTEVA